MRKSILFAAAGASLLLTGCQDNFMGEHRYETLPVEEVPYAEESPVKKNTDYSDDFRAPVRQAKPVPVKPAVVRQKYEPMTGVVSSGGVDSTAVNKKNTKTNTAAVTAIPSDGVHIVRNGDTPDRIARKYNVKLSALMAANNLTEESAKRLQVNQKLVIPSGGKKVSSKLAAKAEKKEADKVQTDSNGKYVVRSGDTPERIARKFKVKLKDLMAANNLTEASARNLQIGQELVIPGKSAAAPQAIPSSSDAEKSSANTTIEGDTNKDVAPPTAVSEQTDNIELDNYDIIELDADTTYTELASKYNISEAKLREINIADPTQTKLVKGDPVFVPKR